MGPDFPGSLKGMTGNIESIVSQMRSGIPLGRMWGLCVGCGAVSDGYEKTLEMRHSTHPSGDADNSRLYS